MMTAVISVIDSKIKESWPTKCCIAFALKMKGNTKVKRPCKTVLQCWQEEYSKLQIGLKNNSFRHFLLLKLEQEAEQISLEKNLADRSGK